jgi:hypothetical protein
MVVRPVFLPPPPPKITPKNEVDRVAALRAQAQKLREQIALAKKMGEAEEAAKLQKKLKQTNQELTRLDPPPAAPPQKTPPLLAPANLLLTTPGTSATPALYFGPKAAAPGLTPVYYQNPADAPKPGADAGAIVKDVEAGKSIDQIAKERGLPRDKVIGELEAGGYKVKTTSGDHGDVGTTRIRDPKSGRTVTEYHDYQHGSYYTEVKDGKGKTTSTPVRDESGQKVTTSTDPKTGMVTTRREDDLGTGTITETTRLPSGVETVRTTTKDGKTTTVVTDAAGKKTTLAAGQDPTRKGAEGIEKDVAAGKSIDQIAKERGLSRAQVEAQLAAAGLNVKTSAAENGDVRSTEIIDQKTGKPVAGYYMDYQHDTRTTLSTDAKGNTVSTSTDGNGVETKKVVEPDGRTTSTVKDGKKTTVSVTFNGYTLITGPDGKVTLHNDTTGREVKVKPGTAEEALAKTLVSIDPNSSDPQEAKQAKIVKSVLDGIFAGEEVADLDKAVTALHKKTQDAIKKYGEGLPVTGATPENPYGTRPLGKAPSGGDWVPMDGKWVDPEVEKATKAENSAIARRAEAAAQVRQSQAQLNVYAHDPSYKKAMAGADALLDQKLAPYGLQWNAPEPEGSLAAAKKELAAANSQLTDASSARENYEKAEQLLNSAIAQPAQTPPLPNQAHATTRDDTTNYELKDAQYKAAYDKTISLYYEAGLYSSKGDKALADYLVDIRKEELDAAKPGTKAWTTANDNLKAAKKLSGEAGNRVDAATAYYNYYSAVSNVSGQEVNLTDLKQKIFNQYRQTHPDMFDMDEKYSTIGGDYLGKIKNIELVEHDNQLYVKTTYEHDSREVQLTFAMDDKNVRDETRNTSLNKQWQGLSSGSDDKMCYVNGSGGLAAAKSARAFARGQIHGEMKDQLGQVVKELDKQIGGLKNDLSEAITKHGPGSVEAPAGLLPPGAKPVKVTVDGQEVEVIPDLADAVQKGGVDAIKKSGKPVRIQIGGEWMWVHPDVAAAQIALGSAEDDRAAAERARKSAEQAQNWYTFLGMQPQMLTDGPQAADYYQGQLKRKYLDEHRDEALPGYQTDMRTLYDEAGYTDEYRSLGSRNEQEALVSGALGLNQVSEDGSQVVGGVLNEIHDIGGDNPSVRVVPFFYLDGKTAQQQSALFAVRDGDGKTWYVDATGQKFESLQDFQDNNRQFEESGELVVPKGLDMKPSADGTIDVEVVQARNVSAWDKFIDPIAGGITTVATIASFTPLAPVAVPVAVAGGAYLGTRAIIKEVSYLHHGGELGDMESVTNIGMAATGFLPVFSGGLRTAGLLASRELASVPQAIRAGIGATRGGTPLARTAENYLRSPGALNRTARGFDWTAIGTGSYLTGTSVYDVAVNGDQMTDSQRLSAFVNLGVGIAGTGLGTHGLIRTRPVKGRTAAGGTAEAAAPTPVDTTSGGYRPTILRSRLPEAAKVAYSPTPDNTQPTPIFRGDTRAPDEIFRSGFNEDGQPKPYGRISTSLSASDARPFAAGSDGGWLYTVVSDVSDGQIVESLPTEGPWTRDTDAYEIGINGSVPPQDILAARPVDPSGRFEGPPVYNPNFKDPARIPEGAATHADNAPPLRPGRMLTEPEIATNRRNALRMLNDMAERPLDLSEMSVNDLADQFSRSDTLMELLSQAYARGVRIENRPGAAFHNYQAGNVLPDGATIDTGGGTFYDPAEKLVVVDPNMLRPQYAIRSRTTFTAEYVLRLAHELSHAADGPPPAPGSYANREDYVRDFRNDHLNNEGYAKLTEHIVGYELGLNDGALPNSPFNQANSPYNVIFGRFRTGQISETEAVHGMASLMEKTVQSTDTGRTYGDTYAQRGGAIWDKAHPSAGRADPGVAPADGQGPMASPAQKVPKHAAASAKPAASPTRKQLQATDPKKLDISQLTEKTVPWLKPTQVADFTPKQWTALKQAGLQVYLTRPQLRAVPQNRLRNLDIGALTGKQASWLTEGQMGALTGKQLQTLGQKGLLAHLTRKQIGAIPQNRVKYLDVSKLTESQVGGFSQAQMGALTEKQWSALNQAGLHGGLTRTQTRAIPEARLAKLDVSAFKPQQISWLTAKQWKALNASGVQSGLTKAQMEAIPDARFKDLDVGGLTAQQVPWLTDAQIAALGDGQWAALAQAGLQRHLTGKQMEAIPADRIPQLDMSGFDAKQLSWLSRDQAKAITDGQKKAIGADERKVLDDIRAIHGLSPQKVAKFSGKKLKSLTDAEWRAFDGDQLRAISHRKTKSVNVAALRPGQIPELTVKQAGALTLDQIRALTPDQVAAFTPDQLAALGPERLQVFNLEQAEALTASQKAKLGDDQKKLLDLDTVRSLTDSGVADLSIDDWLGFSTAQMQAFTGRQLRAVPREIVKYLDLAALKPSQLKEFTPDQVEAFTPQQMKPLSEAQLQAFTRPQADVLKPYQTALVKKDRRGALNGYTPASRPVRAMARARASGVGDFATTMSTAGTLAVVWPMLPEKLQFSISAGGYFWRGSGMIAKAVFPNATAAHTRLGRAIRYMDTLSYIPHLASGYPTSLDAGGVSSAFYEGSNVFYASKAFREARTGQTAFPLTDRTHLPSYLIGSGFGVGQSMTHETKGGADLAEITPGHFVSDGLGTIPGAGDTVGGFSFAIGSGWLWARARFGTPRWFAKMSIPDRVIFGVTFGGGLILYSGMTLAKGIYGLDHKDDAKDKGADKTPPTPQPTTGTTTPAPTPTPKPTGRNGTETPPEKKPGTGQPGEDKPKPRQFVVTADDGLNLRQAPAIDSPVVTVARPGSFVEESDKPKTDTDGNRWVPVQAYGPDGTTHRGWVEASYVEPHPAGGQDGKGRLNPELERRGFTAVIVRDGDTMGGIARSHSADVQATVLLNMDHITSPNVIFAGDRIYLPGAIA